MKYEMLEFNRLRGSLSVKYMHDDDSGKFLIYNIDVPIENGSYISGESLKNYIDMFAPQAQMSRLEEVNTVIIPPELDILPDNSTVTVEEQVNVRERRNMLLLDSDWTQLPDAPINVEEKQAWVAYRQELRDLPKKEGFPKILFPLAPNEEPR